MDLLKDKSERILGIDFGEKRVGIAISDPLKMFAIPLLTINNDSNFWRKFKNVFDQYNIVQIALGYPLKEDGSKTKISSIIEEFGKKLEIKFNVSVEYVDERYSSAIAWEQIVIGVPSKKKRRDKSLIDKNAAAVILSDYLKTNE